MRSEKEITDIQSQILNQLVNTDDERETVFCKGQIRILSWILSDSDPLDKQVPVLESNDEETGGD